MAEYIIKKNYPLATIQEVEITDECVERIADAVVRKLKDVKDNEIAIEQLPSAEQEIVRCRNCRFYQFFNEYNQFGCALAVSRFVYKPNDFCSRAERRTNGTD